MVEDELYFVLYSYLWIAIKEIPRFESIQLKTLMYSGRMKKDGRFCFGYRKCLVWGIKDYSVMDYLARLLFSNVISVL